MERYLEHVENIAEYVVRGAKIKCTSGYSTDVLNMPYSHGVFLRDQPQLNVKDSKSGSNIVSFGFCSKKEAICKPELTDNWINNSETNLKVANEYALLKNACLFCGLGGKITINTSGQN